MKRIAALFLTIILSVGTCTSCFAKPLSKATAKSPCTISCIGDSITYSNTYTIVLNAMPEINVKNYGMSGTQVAGLLDPNSFVNRTKGQKYKSDIILIFGGTNDFKGVNMACNPLGDLNGTDITTYYGAYNTMISNIKKNNKGARIVLVTPIKRLYHENPNAFGLTLSQYAAATQLVAFKNGLYCIDLFNNPNCDFTGEGDTRLIDGIHPDIKGHTAIATEIYKYLMMVP